MKKVIAAVVFMLLVAVFAPFGASDVAFANDGKTFPPNNSFRHRARRKLLSDL